MTTKTRRTLAAGLVSCLVLLAAGFGTIIGGPLGPSPAHARYADWPSYDTIDNAKCIGSG